MAKTRSVKALIAEHEKYRRLCLVRIKPSLQLTALATAIAAAMLWYKPTEWVLPTVLVAFPVLFTAMEIAGYFRHDRAMKRMANEDI